MSFTTLLNFWVTDLSSAGLITVFDGYKYVGMMQICVARMLQESGIFFAVSSLFLCNLMTLKENI